MRRFVTLAALPFAALIGAATGAAIVIAYNIQEAFSSYGD